LVQMQHPAFLCQSVRTQRIDDKTLALKVSQLRSFAA
jgi:hypothetical protein